MINSNIIEWDYHRVLDILFEKQFHLFDSIIKYVAHSLGRRIRFSKIEYWLTCATSDGNLEKIKYILSISQDRSLIDISDGNVHYVKIDNLLLHAAIEGGNLNVLIYLHEEQQQQLLNTNKSDKVNGISLLERAAVVNRLDMVEWLHRVRNEKCTIQSIETAIKNDNIFLFQFLVENCHTNAGTMLFENSSGVYKLNSELKLALEYSCTLNNIHVYKMIKILKLYKQKYY